MTISDGDVNVNVDSRAIVVVGFAAFAGLIQIGTNLHNDYADFVKGADNEKRGKFCA